MKVHNHSEQFDGKPHAWCGRSDNAVPSDQFEATPSADRCKVCEADWFPHGQPDWHFQQAKEKIQ